jgi:hypothetical protein
MALIRTIFHPLSRLIIAITSTLLLAAAVIVFFNGEMRAYFLTYDVPIALPFVLFLLDRLTIVNRITLIGKSLEFAVLTVALIRSVIPLPLVSGHALFLSYALATSSSWITRIAATIVLLEVAYFKVFAWNDETIVGGIVTGLIAAYLFRRFGLSNSVPIAAQQT